MLLKLIVSLKILIFYLYPATILRMGWKSENNFRSRQSDHLFHRLSEDRWNRASDEKL